MLGLRVLSTVMMIDEGQGLRWESETDREPQKSLGYSQFNFNIDEVPLANMSA